MTAFFLFAAGCVIYCSLYLAHCIRTGRKNAAAGALLLVLASAACALLLL